MKEKLKKLREVIKKENEDCLFLDYLDPNHFWLLQKKIDGSFIIVKKTGKPILLVGALEKFESEDFIVKPLKKENFPKKALVNKKFFKLKYADFIKAKATDIDVRDVKEKDELSKIKKACKYTDDCFELIVKGLKKRKYKKEKDVEREIRIFAAKHDLDIAFDPIVASSSNASVPHHDNFGVLRKGFLVLDFGFKFEGYCSDMTRTLYLGKINKKERELYDLLLKCQKESISNCVVGEDLKNIDSKTREKLGSYSKYFIHSLGHGIGIEVHEEPFFREKTILKKNHVITVEPGIYKKEDFGIRIEDTILITDKKPEILTKTTKKLIEIS